MPNSSIPGIRKIRHASDTNFGTLTGKNGQVVTYESSTDSFILAAPPGGGGGTNDHSALINLSYAASGHTGFAGTGVANTFNQLQTFLAGVTVTGGNLAVANNANVTGDVNVGDDVVVTGDVTTASVISPLLTSATNVDVTINPGGTGNVLVPNDTPVRSQTFDSSFPIGGFKVGPTGVAGQSGLTVGVIQADEIRTRVFVADETRVDRGDEYWTRSYGILAASFTTPASIGGTTTVTFEDSAALVAAIAADNYWVLFRRAEITTGIDTFTSWGQLVGYVDNGDGTQSFTFVLRAGSASALFMRGSVGVIFGQSGDGLIHLSTVDPAGAPYIKIRKWTTNPYTPANYTTYVQIGNLAATGASAYSPVGYGLYARSTANYSQFIVLDDNGFQIRSADFEMYNSAIQTVDIASSNGSLKLGSNVNSGTATGFHFDGATGNITIGGGSYAPTVTVYGQIVIKPGSTGYSNIGGIPTSLNNINGGEYSHLAGIESGATAGADWGTNLDSIPTRFGNAPGSAGLYLTATHMGYYNGSAWKAWIASNGFFYFGGSSGAHLEWNGTKLRGIGTDGTTEKWYASSTDGTLYGGGGAVWMDQTGYNIATTVFGNPDYIRFSRSGVLGASIGYQRASGGGVTTTDGIRFNIYEGGKFHFMGGIGIKTDGSLEADGAATVGTLQSLGALSAVRIIAIRPPGTSPGDVSAQIQGTTHHSLFAEGLLENTYIRGGKPGAHVAINDTAGLGNVYVAGGGGLIYLTSSSGAVHINGPVVNLAPASGNTGTTKGLREYGSGYDGTRFWAAAVGMNLFWDGTNYRTGTDGGTNGGSLMLAGGSGDTLELFTLPSSGTSSQTVTAANLNNHRRLYASAAGVVVTGAVTETAQGIDNVRFGNLAGTPRVIWEDAGQTQWEVDNSAGLLRFSTPSAVHAYFKASNGNMTIGGTPGTFDWRLNVMSSTFQLSLNPNFGGINYLSSYDGAVGAPLGLYGTRVFVDGNAFGISTAKTPTSSADASGNTGDWAWDTGFVYIKTGPGAWKRAVLATF